MIRLKRINILLAILLLFLIIAITLIGADRVIETAADGKVYNDTNLIPQNKAGLLLGTSKYLNDGRENLFYKYRIEAAKELFDAQKVDVLVVSGDNGRKTYNEPETMKDDLVALGIPESDIYLDYAGFRTLDSIVRMDKIFGQTDFTVISQEFHNERAIYLARKNNLNAIGYNATAVPIAISPRVWLRERLARVKVFIDLFLGIQPKFLGEPVRIN